MFDDPVLGLAEISAGGRGRDAGIILELNAAKIEDVGLIMVWVKLREIADVGLITPWWAAVWRGGCASSSELESESGMIAVPCAMPETQRLAMGRQSDVRAHFLWLRPTAA